MSTSIRRGRSRLFALLVAVVTLFAGIGGIATASEPEFGNIQEKRGSLVIHKHESGSQGAVGTPDGKTDVGGRGVPGVGFTAYKIVELDLLNRATDWDKVASLPVNSSSCDAPAISGYTLDAGNASNLTNDSGDARIDNLPIGAYLICETVTPNTVVKKAEPFIVTVPHPDAAGSSGWLYEVNVYPKNTVVEAPKKTVTVNSRGIQTDGQLTYTVTAKIPSLATNEHFRFFSIIDDLDTEHSDLRIVSVQISETTDPNGPYVPYNVGDFGPDVQENNQWVAIQVTDLNILRLLKNFPQRHVRLTFEAKVKELPTEGTLDNRGYVAFDTITSPTPPTVAESANPVVTNGKGQTPVIRGGTGGTITPSNMVRTTWGNFIALKYDAALTDQSRPLQGAKFKVYEAEQPYAGDCRAAVKKDDNAITIDGVSEFESDRNGQVHIQGLYVDQAEGQGNAEPVIAYAKRCYVLVESVAPVGFTLDPTPKGIAVAAGATGANTSDIQIPNTRQSVPQLPLTGANGEVLMALIGGALFLFAFGTFLIRRRRRSEDSTQ